MSYKSIPRVMLCGHILDSVLEIKSIFLTCIYICRIVLGEHFYEYCVIMVKKLFLAKYIKGPMLILKTMTVCTVNLKHDKRDTLTKQLFTNIFWTTPKLEIDCCQGTNIFSVVFPAKCIMFERKLVCRLTPWVNCNLICLKDEISCII